MLKKILIKSFYYKNFFYYKFIKKTVNEFFFKSIIIYVFL